MTALFVCLKKEYWEERNILLGLPIGLSVIVIMSLIIALFVGVRYSNQFDIDFDIDFWSNNSNTSTAPLNFTEDLQLHDESQKLFQRDPDLNSASNSVSQNNKNQNGYNLHDYGLNDNGLHDYGHNANSAIFGLIFVFMSISWFAGLSYLLSSLYKDRKDKTVLFWKSLPVSEQVNVLVKLFFGAFCYTGVALVIAWVTCIIIFVLLFFVQNLVGAQGVLSAMLSELTFMSFIVLPFLSLCMAALWGVPVFGYVLLVSALVKRAPFFMAIWPPLAIILIEKIIFDSENSLRYFISLFPLPLFSGAHVDQGVIYFMGDVLRDDMASILLSGLLAVGCVGVAVWFRNNRFEL